jgi:hypothetical protein
MFRRTAIWSLSLALAAAAPLVVASDDAAPVAVPPKAEAPMPKRMREVCTGSRIRPAVGQPCPSASALRSYSQADLQRTGQNQIADALRLIDPIFR